MSEQMNGRRVQGQKFTFAGSHVDGVLGIFEQQVVTLIALDQLLGSRSHQLFQVALVVLVFPGQSFFDQPQRFEFHSARHSGGQGLHGHRLAQVLKGIQMNRRRSRFHGGQPGDQDHRRVRLQPVALFQDVQAVLIAQKNVGNNGIEDLVPQQVLGFGMAAGGFYPVTETCQLHAKGITDRTVIVHD